MSLEYKNVKFYKFSRWLIMVVLVGLVAVESRINNQIFDATVYLNKQILISKIQSSSHRFSIKSTDKNYELNGQVYESDQIADQSDLYNISKYKKSQSCTYFKSLLQMQSLEGQILDFTVVQSVLLQKYNLLVLIGMQQSKQNSKQFIKVYSYTSNSSKFVTKITFQQTQLNSQMLNYIFLTSFNGFLLFSDGNLAYHLDVKMASKNATVVNSSSPYSQNCQFSFKWNKIGNFNNGLKNWNNQQFIGINSVKYQSKQLVLFLYTEKIVMYQYFSSNQSVKIFIQINKDSSDLFQDVEIGANNSFIYVLAGNHLSIYKPQNLSTPSKHELAGQLCTRIYIHHQTVEIICEFKRKNFIGQYFYSQADNKLILNRFYNDVQNYRQLTHIQNYVLMVAQNDIIVTSKGVNRKILLEMTKNAYSQRFASFGIENIILLKKQQVNSNDNLLLFVGQDFIQLFILKLVPAQILCNIKKVPVSAKMHILMVRNTSTCQMNQRKQTLKSICLNAKPIQILFQKYQIQSKSTTIFFIIVLLAVCIFVFLCLGCVFRQSMNLNNVAAQIKQKINKIKPQRSNQFKEI